MSEIENTDIAQIFPGSKVVPLPRRCEHCSKSKELKGAPRWRRRGRIVPRTWPDGRVELGCHYCGRAVKVEPVKEYPVSDFDGELLR